MTKLQTRKHFLSGATLVNSVKVLFNNRSEISPKYVPQVFLILLTPLLLFPLQLCERLFFTGRIKRTRISKDPVFIIGHFRTGTTYMHNLLCQDTQFGFPTTYQCFVPAIFLTGKGFIKSVHKTTLPERRPMDDVLLHSDFPQEEEFAILALSEYSFYQCYFFPRKTKEFFTNYSMVKHNNSRKWENVYMFFLKKITYVCQGKQLVIKNPVNTARINQLIKMFPDARFIYLYRDPEQVFRSTCKLFDRFLSLYSFHDIEKEELLENIRWVYNQTIIQYEQQKQSVPAQNLVEIHYADFIHNPLAQLERIYHKLNLDGFEAAKNNFIQYIKTQADYKPDPSCL